MTKERVNFVTVATSSIGLCSLFSQSDCFKRFFENASILAILTVVFPLHTTAYKSTIQHVLKRPWLKRICCSKIFSILKILIPMANVSIVVCFSKMKRFTRKKIVQLLKKNFFFQ